MAFANYFLITDMFTNTVQYFWLIDTYVCPLVTCFSSLKISRYHLFAFAAFHLCHVNSKHFNYGRRWPLYDATVNEICIVAKSVEIERRRINLYGNYTVCIFDFSFTSRQRCLPFSISYGVHVALKSITLETPVQNYSMDTVIIQGTNKDKPTKPLFACR